MDKYEKLGKIKYKEIRERLKDAVDPTASAINKLRNKIAALKKKKEMQTKHLEQFQVKNKNEPAVSGKFGVCRYRRRLHTQVRRGFTSSIDGDVGRARAWQASTQPALFSAGVIASSVSIATEPATNLTLHWPHIPERHSNGRLTPTDSEASRRVVSGVRVAVFPDRANVAVDGIMNSVSVSGPTVDHVSDSAGAFRGSPSTSAERSGTPGETNASNRIFDSGTPILMSSSWVELIMASGPQT